MAKLKISEDLFLEKQELNRLVKFLEFDGYKQEFLLNTTTFGIVKGYNLPSALNTLPKDSFLVDNIGAASNTVNIRTGRAINNKAEIITLDSNYTLQIPANGLWYWIKISYRKVNYEVGTIDIDANGNMSGFGTFFTEVLRGQPNFTTKIKFLNSTLNNLEYDVVDVVGDTSAILSGDFLAESGLQYVVVGTFTPGFVPLNADKNIYEYDNVNISIVSETPSTPGVPPGKIDNEEFYLARVRTSGLNVEIQDKRLEFWQTRAEYEIHLIDRFSNTIIGVESVKWDIEFTPRDRNEVNIAWGYRSTNWSVDTTQNVVTINSGVGGILKENDLSQFINGSFDGWRLYTKSGKYNRVVSSTKTGTQLNLKLDYLDFNEFDVTDEIHIVPDVEEIEIKASYDIRIHKIIEESFVFPIYFSTGKFYLRIYDSKLPYDYNLLYRYKVVREYTDWQVFPNDPVGYYDETSFDDYGIIKPNVIDRNQVPYNGSLTNGFVTITPNPKNFNVVLGSLITGDLFGLDHKTVTNANPIIDLIVGQDRQMQVLSFTGLTLANDIFINLNKTRVDATPCINGNRFIIQLEGNLTLNSRNLRIVTDYVNNTTYTSIRDILQIDVNFIKQNQRLQRSGLVLIFTYDGTDWWCSISNEMNGVPKNTIVTYGGSLSDFDNTGLGAATDVLGWALCNGNYGTLDLRGRVEVAYSNTDPDYTSPTTLGGSKYVTLGSSNVPAHQHTFTGSGTASTGGGHDHTVESYDGRQENNDGAGDRTDVARPGGSRTTSWHPGHTHPVTVSGTTDPGGGSGSVTPVDNRQPYMTVIKIQKII